LTSNVCVTDQAKQIIPGGVQHNLAFNYPFPIAIEKAEGAYLWDADGNKWFSGIFRDAPPNVGRIANPTYAAPPDMLVYHGNSQ
jgi:4-aminobutyrate aminotransferase-like enzyme